VLGGLLIALGFAMRIAPPWELSSELGCLKKGSRRISFEEIRSVDVTETRLGRRTAVGIRVNSNRGAIWLVPGQLESRRSEIQRVAERVKAELRDTSTTREHVAGSPTRFWVTFFVGFGAFWAGSMAWLAPHVVLKYSAAKHGFLLWPFGLWIAALGLGELAGLKLVETTLGPWNRRRVILFAVWMGSYCAVSFVPL
jgi:hypothetical protein